MPGVSSAAWGPGGVRLYSFASQSGFLRCRVSNYGATLVSLEVSDGKGGWDETTLGYDTFDEWKQGPCFFGCTVGRYGNRINKGRFELDGATYTLETNNGPNHLHGGSNGYDKKVWEAEPVSLADASGVRFSMTSPDGDAGYPGALSVEAWIMLGKHDELMFKWKARVGGKATVLNLTNHTYWNLAAWRRTGADALGHSLWLDADKYVEVDGDAIPTGRLPASKGTVLDFSARGGRELRGGVDSPLVAPQAGYDQCVVFAGGPPAAPQPAADGGGGAWAAGLPHRGRLHCAGTGYGFDLHTTQPGVQVYTANYVDDGHKGFGGSLMKRRGAVCLEAQNFPDAPNQPSFPSSVLRPGELYEQTTVHRFFRSATAAL